MALSLILAALAFSCTVEEPAATTPEAPQIRATTDSGKTGITSDGASATVYWNPGDQINVFFGSKAARYFSTNTQKAGSAVFKTSDSVEGGTQGNIWGLYPYDPTASCDGSSVSTSIKAGQLGVEGSFDDALAPSLATSGTFDLQFYNVCGGLRFSLKRDDILSISFRGNRDEALAGDVRLTMGQDSRPVAQVTAAENTIRMVPKEGRTFKAGQDYYMIMLPGELSDGFTMTFETALETGTLKIRDKVSVQRSHFMSKSAIDGKATFKTTRKITVKEGTLVRTSVADPSIIYEDGVFHLTMTGSSNLAMIHEGDLSKLTTSYHSSSANLIYKSAEDPTVEEFFGNGATINGTWSPEIHHFTEEDWPGCSGWYIYFGIRKKDTDSKYIKMVLLKSASLNPEGPYVHPVDGEEYHTQPILNAAGVPLPDWGVGPSILRIPSGKHKGIYLLWIDEVGRGQGLGKFYQRIMIARLASPWKLAGPGSVITTPTQDWEKKGASNILPQVVEGGTAVYGKHGEIFLIYCGSGYWSNYGLGQLTLKRENGDYADPLKTDSWVKYDKNPIFSSVKSTDLRGAGHAFLLNDAAGNGFLCYHAYPYVNGKKASARNSYIEPFFIDYSAISDSAPCGVVRLGLEGNGVTAPVNSTISFIVEK